MEKSASGLSGLPFLRILIPAVVGILTAMVCYVPLAVAASCCAVAVACAWIFRRGVPGQIYAWLAVALFFFTMSEVRRPESSLPAGRRIVFEAEVLETPTVRGRWRATTARVSWWRYAEELDGSSEWNYSDRDTASGPKGLDWQRVEEKVLLSVDTTYRLRLGDRLLVRGWFNPLVSFSAATTDDDSAVKNDSDGESYVRLMHRRGVFGRVYVTPGNLLDTLAAETHSPSLFFARLQSRAVERLARLHLAPDEYGVAAAMTLGDRRAIGSDLREAYARSGAVHLLAVSGLHVGMVFVLINLFLWLLPAFPRGHVAKNLAAILLIWLYAALTGLSPSVVRAALMFSFAQVALAASTGRSALNILLASAVVMLAINPNYAGDVSFQLSYAAVLAILLFYPPVYRWGRTRSRLWNVVWGVTAVGLVATLGTAPLVSYWFGRFPLVGVVINPAVVLMAHVVVMGGLLWVVCPIGWLAPLFGGVISTAARWQNEMVVWAAAQSWASAGGRLPLWGVLTIYAFYIVLAVVLHRRKREKSLSLPV